MVIDHNAVPIFVQLLASPNDDVREQVGRAACVGKGKGGARRGRPHSKLQMARNTALT